MRKALLILALLLPAAFPAISGLSLTGSIDSSGIASMKAAAEFHSSEGELACINISAPAADVAVRDRSGLLLEHEAVSEGNSTRICATVPTDYLEYELSSPSFTAKSGSLWEFDFAIGASMDIRSLNASMSLPQGATLKGTNGAVADGGDSLVIFWSADGVDTSHRARMRASYELAPAQPGPDYAFIAIGAVMALFLAFLAIERFRKPRLSAASVQAGQPPGISGSIASPAAPGLEENAVFRTLDETDREIVLEMARQGGKTTQAHLHLHTHVPKATLSRRLSSLENKGLIQKSHKGNRNLVSLTDILRK